MKELRTSYSQIRELAEGWGQASSTLRGANVGRSVGKEPIQQQGLVVFSDQSPRLTQSDMALQYALPEDTLLVQVLVQT